MPLQATSRKSWQKRPERDDTSQDDYSYVSTRTLRASTPTRVVKDEKKDKLYCYHIAGHEL